MYVAADAGCGTPTDVLLTNDRSPMKVAETDAERIEDSMSSAVRQRKPVNRGGITKWPSITKRPRRGSGCEHTEWIGETEAGFEGIFFKDGDKESN